MTGKTTLTNSETEQFWRDGFIHIPGVFSADEIRRWRSRSLESGAAIDELMSDPVLREMLLHPACVGITRSILGSDPIYYGGSMVRIGLIGGTGFHKDNSDRYDPKAPDWSVERYPLLAYGIYMQDHAGLPEGLEVRIGSHMHPDITSGERVAPPLRKGDLIVWTQRTTHSANSQIIKGLGHRIMPNGLLWRLLNRLPKSLWHPFLRKHPELRVTAICTVGADHPLFDRHMAYKRSRTYQVDAWKNAQWADDVTSLAADLGLKVITPAECLEGVGATNDAYQQIPY